MDFLRLWGASVATHPQTALALVDSRIKLFDSLEGAEEIAARIPKLTTPEVLRLSIPFMVKHGTIGLHDRKV